MGLALHVSYFSTLILLNPCDLRACYFQLQFVGNGLEYFIHIASCVSKSGSRAAC